MTSEIPSPPYLPIIGHAHYLLTGVYKNLNRLTKELGPIFQLRLANQKITYVSGLNLIKEISDDSKFDKYLGNVMKGAREILEDGLLTGWTDEPNWEKAHRILLPGFSQNAMSGYVPIIDNMIKKMLSEWAHLPPGKEINMRTEMGRLSLEIISISGFDYCFNSFVINSDHPFITDLNDVMKDIQMTAYMPKFLKKIRYFQNKKQEKRIRNLNETIEEVLRARVGDSQSTTTDFLSSMLKNKDKVTDSKLDLRNIKSQILTFLVAGHETTANLLSFTFYYLSKHPEFMEKALKEVESILGTDISRTPSLQEIFKLEYVQQILQESLRLWPPAPYISRFPYQDTLLDGKYQVKKNDWIWLLIPNLHRLKEVWGEDAEDFKPERFSKENKAKIDPDAYIPFGIGQRSCIGRQFAMTEAILTIARVIQRYKLYLRDNYKLVLDQSVTIKPDKLFMKLEERALPHRQASQFLASDEDQEKKMSDRLEEKYDVRQSNDKSSSDNPSNGHLTLLYGSNTGTAEGIAKRVSRDGQSLGFEIDYLSLDKGPQLFAKKDNFFIVTSTYNGQPPDNAVKFYEWLQILNPINKPFEGINFIIFGCGNSQWRTYQFFPIFLQKRLIELGANEIYPRGEVDGNSGDEEVFERWYAEFWTIFKNIDKKQILQIKELEEKPIPLQFVLENNYAKTCSPCIRGDEFEVFLNDELQAHESNPALRRSTRHIEFKLPSHLIYQTGDHLTVMPENDLELVNKVLLKFKLDSDLFINIKGNQQTFLPIEQEISLVELLRKFVELREPATRRHIKILAHNTLCPPQSIKLQQLAEDPYYKEQVLGCRLSIMDLLEMFSSCELSFATYLSLLAPMRVRYYSISSSPNKIKDRLSLTVRAYNFQKENINLKGVCSNYLANKQKGERIYGHISEQKNFLLPSDPIKPLILVCAGTGIAPFRGFLEEREVMANQGKDVGKAYLFFGLRDPNVDFLYREELIRMENNGTVEIYIAPSRSKDHPKCYVQDKIIEQQELIWKLINEEAIIYVCGDSHIMAPAVQNAFEKVYMAYTKSSALEAKAWIADCFNQRKYLLDAWLTSPTVGPSL